MLARPDKNAFGHVKIDPDTALMELYRRLKERGAPAPGSFSTLQADDRRAYFRDAKRKSRSRFKAASSPPATAENVRAALADAALIILALDAPGADHVRQVLANVFAARPGVPLSVEQRARSGKLKTKLAGSSK